MSSVPGHFDELNYSKEIETAYAAFLDPARHYPIENHNSKPSEWFIITGGPGYGKTTILEELERRGCHVVQEAAIHIIKQYQKEGTERPWELDCFQQDILNLQKKWQDEAAVNFKGRRVFFDRSPIDSLAYTKLELNRLKFQRAKVLLRLYKAQMDKRAQEEITKKKKELKTITSKVKVCKAKVKLCKDSVRELLQFAPYQKTVFLIESLNLNTQNESRHEDPKEAARIHRQLIKTYNQKGFKLESIPKNSVNARVLNILIYVKDRA